MVKDVSVAGLEYYRLHVSAFRLLNYISGGVICEEESHIFPQKVDDPPLERDILTHKVVLEGYSVETQCITLSLAERMRAEIFVGVNHAIWKSRSTELEGKRFSFGPISMSPG
jgi:hypothetical protein